ncbi:MAG: AsnC family transcriptional regulator, partial [Candidatus Jordarchaeaceae archaeon]
MSIDDIDSKLLEILKKDSRTPASKIADELGISRMTVKNRMDHVREKGRVTEFVTDLPKEHLAQLSPYDPEGLAG